MCIYFYKYIYVGKVFTYIHVALRPLGHIWGGSLYIHTYIHTYSAPSATSVRAYISISVGKFYICIHTARSKYIIYICIFI